MRTKFTTLCFLILCVAGASAQMKGPAAPAGRSKTSDVSLGYAYLDHPVSQSDRAGLSGFDASATVGLSSRLALRVDLGYVRSGNVLGTPTHSGVLSYMAGPVFYPMVRPKFDIYVQALFGGARVSGPVPTNTGILTGGWTEHPAWAVGGGMDYQLSDSFALRAGADYMRTEYFSSALAIQGQNNIRLTASVVYLFGPLPRKRR